MTIEEKGVFIQKKSIIVSLKGLVLLKCLNTFVHECRLKSTKLVSAYLCFDVATISYEAPNVLKSLCGPFAGYAEFKREPGLSSISG